MRIKIIISICAALCLFNQVEAQNKKSKVENSNFIGISYGKSFPLSDFAKNNQNYITAGLEVNTGNKFDLYYGHFITQKWGWTAMVRLQQFPRDLDLQESITESLNPGISFTATSKDWKCASVLGGVFYAIPVSKKMSINPRVMTGVMFAKSPSIKLTANGSNNTAGWESQEASGAGFAFEAGVGLTSRLGKHFALMPLFDISGGFPHIGKVTTLYNNGTKLEVTVNPQIISFNMGLSLAYRF